MDAKQVMSLMKELDQKQIIKDFKKLPESDKNAFVDQVNQFEKIYPGGLREYVKRAKKLLDDSKNNVNPFEGYTPEIPVGFNVKVGTEEFYELDKNGFDLIKDTVFVLVAGGLGERLGYPDIKIGIQTDLITLRTYIEVYIDYILAYEDRLRKKFNLDRSWFIPLCIMTSGDTHDKTVKLLDENDNFGLKENQIVIVKQEKCPALIDNECHFAMEKDRFLIETKPHGHGDVHTLIYQNGLVKKWVEQGKKYMILFQDTNGLIFNSIPSALGVSQKLNLVINTICVPRKPGETVGAICKLNKDDGSSITNNVEYNQLDSLLKSKYSKKGDVPNSEGLSDFPGNTNVLIFELSPYLKELEKTGGLIPEFINPKYTDETKTKFKSPTRLECLMQDFPKLLTGGEKVGFVMFEKWFCFTTCKNNLKDGIEKLKKGLGPEAAFSEEQDLFGFNVKILKDILGKLEIKETEPANTINILGEDIKFGPKIIVYPSFAASVSEMKEKMDKMDGIIKMTNNSSLILKNDVNIDKDVTIDGSCTIDKDQKEPLDFNNKQKWEYYKLEEGQGMIYEQIRGYGVLLKETD